MSISRSLEEPTYVSLLIFHNWKSSIWSAAPQECETTRIDVMLLPQSYTDRRGHCIIVGVNLPGATTRTSVSSGLKYDKLFVLICIRGRGPSAERAYLKFLVSQGVVTWFPFYLLSQRIIPFHAVNPSAPGSEHNHLIHWPFRPCVYLVLYNCSACFLAGCYGDEQFVKLALSCAVMNPSSSPTRCEAQSPEHDLMDDWLFLSPESAGPQHLKVSREEQEMEDRGKLKSKLVSAWNSVKYGLLKRSDISNCLTLLLCKKNRFDCFVWCHVPGWSLKQKSKFGKSSPVIMLGQSYELKDPGEALISLELIS